MNGLTIDFFDSFLAQDLVVDVTENGDETMITLDVPLQLAQNSVEIIQQATPLKKLPRFDYLVKECLVAHGSTTKSAFEQKNWDESSSRLAGDSSYSYDRMNYVADYLIPYDPVLMHQLSQNKHFNEEDKEAINATVKILQLPKHGKLVVNEAVRSQLGVGNFGYIADLNFEGDDQVVFSANYHGKNYKIVMNLRVRYENFSEGPEGDAFEDKLCPNKYNFKRIKLSDTPLTINFTNLAGVAVGETVGEGAAATITLDTDAAGHGWKSNRGQTTIYGSI